MADRELSEEEKRKLWERILTTRTEAAFREFVLDRLNLHPEESILSVGCGPGLETAALAEQVGEEGHVTGIDLNEEVLDAARARCGDLPQVSFELGDITDLPVADESYDLAIAKQVLSEVSDVDAALKELFRVVEPGGRIAVTAADRRTHVKHTPTDRTQRADEIYRAKTSDRQLGTRLVGLLPEAGFTVKEVVPRAKLQREINDQIERGIEVQRRLLEASDSFDDAQIGAWERELRELDKDGQYLSCGVAFLYVAFKPR